MNRTFKSLRKRRDANGSCFAMAVLISTLCMTACSTGIDAPQSQYNGRFEKLDASGSLLSIKAMSWACIRDNKTGLVWEHKTDDEGLRDANWTYAWRSQSLAALSPSSRDREGSCNKRHLQRCTTESYQRAVNAQQLCGYSNWRLPLPDELQSILLEPERPALRQSCDCVFKHGKAAGYWSSQLNTKTLQVDVLDFKTGKNRTFSPNNFFYLMLVSDSKSARDDGDPNRTD